VFFGRKFFLKDLGKVVIGFAGCDRDPGSLSENGFMEPKYYSEEVIGHHHHYLTI